MGHCIARFHVEILTSVQGIPPIHPIVSHKGNSNGETTFQVKYSKQGLTTTIVLSLF